MSQEVPLWLMSPSIFSIIQVGILTLIGTYWLWNGPYKSRLDSFLMSLSSVCFMMTLFDTFYVVFTMARFLPSYPQDSNLMLLSLGRDITATILFYFLPWKLWKRGFIQFNPISALLFSANVWFLYIWIMNAPNLNWINAQQAYVNQPEILWQVIGLGHGLGRVLNTSFWLTLWRH